MKKATAWAEDRLTSASEHKRRATLLRRLASGLKSEVAGAQSSGLSDKEQKDLATAAELLLSMASVRDKAKTDAALRAAIRANREKEITAAIAGNFGRLVSVMDKVCLLAAIRPFGCDLPKMESGDLKYLNGYAQDARVDLIYKLAGTPGPVDEVVSAAWAKFEAARPGYEVKYATVAQRLNKAGK